MHSPNCVYSGFKIVVFKLNYVHVHHHFVEFSVMGLKKSKWAHLALLTVHNTGDCCCLKQELVSLLQYLA